MKFVSDVIKFLLAAVANSVAIFLAGWVSYIAYKPYAETKRFGLVVLAIVYVSGIAISAIAKRPGMAIGAAVGPFAVCAVFISFVVMGGAALVIAPLVAVLLLRAALREKREGPANPPAERLSYSHPDKFIRGAVANSVALFLVVCAYFLSFKGHGSASHDSSWAAVYGIVYVSGIAIAKERAMAIGAAVGPFVAFPIYIILFRPPFWMV